MNTIRAFIAVPLSDEVKRGLGDVARALAGPLPRGAVRWVRPEQIHLTLVFLGDTPTDQLPAIQRGMDAAAENNQPFTLHLGDLGFFPTARRPRVIWIGLAGEVNRLASLKAALDAPLAALGRSPEDKPFRAHLTLGRVRNERDVQGLEWAADVPRLAVAITTIHLIESKLRPDGPVYTVRHMSLLAGQKAVGQ